MDFNWENAQPLFKKLQLPGRGASDRWMHWYQQAWKHLSDAGLTSFATPLDEFRARLRIFALGWLAHDYCAAVTQDDECSCPYWSDWADTLDIKPVWAILTVRNDKMVEAIIQKSDLCSSELIDEDEPHGFCVPDNEIDAGLIPRLVMVAVYVQREKVINALKRGLGGDFALFTSMHLALYSLEDQID